MLASYWSYHVQFSANAVIAARDPFLRESTVKSIPEMHIELELSPLFRHDFRNMILSRGIFSTGQADSNWILAISMQVIGLSIFQYQI